MASFHQYLNTKTVPSRSTMWPVRYQFAFKTLTQWHWRAKITTDVWCKKSIVIDNRALGIRCSLHRQHCCLLCKNAIDCLLCRNAIAVMFITCQPLTTSWHFGDPFLQKIKETGSLSLNAHPHRLSDYHLLTTVSSIRKLLFINTFNHVLVDRFTISNYMLVQWTLPFTGHQCSINN